MYTLNIENGNTGERIDVCGDYKSLWLVWHMYKTLMVDQSTKEERKYIFHTLLDSKGIEYDPNSGWEPVPKK